MCALPIFRHRLWKPRFFQHDLSPDIRNHTLALPERKLGRVRQALAGHPRGLAVLCFTQMLERFSFYGMRALLILYLTEQLLRPGHVEHVAGYSQLAGALTGLFGPMSVQAISSQIYGLYGALTFLTPLFGGLIGARWLGTHRAVFVGGTIIALGHLMMAFEASFLFALLAIILGSGLFTPNISAQVGMPYASGDDRRDSRSEERREGKECGRTCRSRWPPYH